MIPAAVALHVKPDKMVDVKGETFTALSHLRCSLEEVVGATIRNVATRLSEL